MKKVNDMAVNVKEIIGKIISKKLSENLKEDFKNNGILFEIEPLGKDYIEAIQVKIYGYQEVDSSVGGSLVDRLSDEIISQGYHTVRFKYPKRTPKRLLVGE